ncbi:MAG TPA: hypothetical protein VMD30_00855 [Tepidisphaeraceae bacterium]|nr:hypothetical protein [Tepidisphaeraceae bacterium]
MKRSLLSAAVLAFLATIIGCHPTASFLNVPLTYSPSNGGNGGSFTLPNTKVYVAQIVDQRSNTTEIGENHQNEKPIPIYAEDTKPPEFLRKVMIEDFRNDGLNVVDSADDADRVVNITLQRFWVTETDTYDAQVTLIVQVTDKSGNVLASNMVARGESSTFGRTLSPENYQQVLSDATDQAISYLLKNEDFLKAISAGKGE